MRKTTIILIYFLSFYIILQFVWWGYHLFQLNEQVLESESELNKKYMMIIGEGVVFFSILLFGIVRLMRSIKKEIELNRQKRNFLLSVTHELKTPLASIKLNLQTIKKRQLDQELQNKLIHKSEAEIVRLENIVNNILAVTRIESKSQLSEKENIDLSELVKNQVQLMSENFGKNHHFNQHIQKGVHWNGDPGLFQLILSNLIENAIKYSSENTEIEINLTLQNGKVELIVKDQGIGISKEEREKIFNKFYRAGNEEVRQTKGTGLGLYLVKSLVGHYNGEIQVKTEENKGTEFRIIL
ncbi:MAG: HAMP domain-containing sensor histidine kinase [Crocinitomicaceae bacterium]